MQDGKVTYNIYDASGALVHIDQETDCKATTYLPAAGQSVARVTNGVVTYLHNDHLGSASSGTDASGNIVWTEIYSPYGMTGVDDAANDNLAGFTGYGDSYRNY